jgi:glycosyltransferase A (GT-A) superfamily protein (DUF2064 family)
VRPALILLVDDTSVGVPGLTDDAETAQRLLTVALGHARQVPGVGRVLLFRPPEAESRLARQALGFRLWPQSGDSPGQRYANAFSQAVELGYEGSLVMGLGAATLPVEAISQALAVLHEHHGAVVGDGHGGIALLGLQEPQPTLFSGTAVPTYAELRTRAAQQRVRLLELPEHETLTDGTLEGFLASTARR